MNVVDVIRTKRDGHRLSDSTQWPWAKPHGTWGPDVSHQDEAVSHSAGVICMAKPGEEVRAGQPIFELHTDRPELLSAAEHALLTALQISDVSVDPPPLIIERIP